MMYVLRQSLQIARFLLDTIATFVIFNDIHKLIVFVTSYFFVTNLFLYQFKSKNEAKRW